MLYRDEIKQQLEGMSRDLQVAFTALIRIAISGELVFI